MARSETLTLAQIAVEATANIRARIDAELPGDAAATRPWLVNEIIREEVRSFLPKKAFHDAGLKCDIASGGTAAYKQVAQTVNLEIALRKCHPYYSGSFKPNSLRSVATLFSIKRTFAVCKGKRQLVFKELTPAHSQQKALTLMSIADNVARAIVVGQQYYWKAANVLLDAHEKLGQDGLRALITAVTTVDTLPQFSNDGGSHKIDWSNRYELMKISGKAPRTVAILKAVAAGEHTMPAGIPPAAISAYAGGDK